MMSNLQKVAIESRTVDAPVEDLLVGRWSPRAMSGESIDQAQLLRLLEAARWAPSASNMQPWRFVYAHRETPAWESLFDLLNPGNQEWAHRAAVLVLVLSKTTSDRDGSHSVTHAFDAGAAWENLALQGTAQGLVVHGMGGFDRERARTAASVPDDYAVLAMIAVGRPGDPEVLPERLRRREVPSHRRPVREFAFEGVFGG